MFGHQDDQPQDAAHIPDSRIDEALDAAVQDTSAMTDWQHPGVPLDSTGQPVDTPAPTAPADDQAQAADAQDADPTTAPAYVPVASDDANDLLDIKQHALTQLSPLVDHLEQSPEEKFRTTMMMIQASDDQSLIKPAYEAALAIPDEKSRAQALLDVINEINYFTQQPS